MEVDLIQLIVTVDQSAPRYFFAQSLLEDLDEEVSVALAIFKDISNKEIAG